MESPWCGIYLLSKGAKPGIINGEGKKAKDYATDPEVQYIIGDWEEYKTQNKINISTLGKVKKYH